jgi:hypothetical protein
MDGHVRPAAAPNRRPSELPIESDHNSVDFNHYASARFGAFRLALSAQG